MLAWELGLCRVCGLGGLKEGRSECWCSVVSVGEKWEWGGGV